MLPLSMHILLFAHMHLVFAQLLAPQPPPDQTGVNAALEGLAVAGSALGGGAIMVFFVYHGIAHLFTDESTRGARIKTILAGLAVSAIFILLGVTIAPIFVRIVLTGH